jgi:hypothetical protein
MEEYRFPAIGITYCVNSTANANWCKGKLEIEKFLAHHPAYFVHMETLVQEDIFKDSPLINQFPYMNDKENYFPTVKQPHSINYGHIEVDPELRDTDFLITDIMLSYNNIRINDDPFELSELRRTEFINMKLERSFDDLTENYNFSRANTSGADLIKAITLQSSNVGHAYHRDIRTISDVAADLGGVARTVLAAFATLDVIGGYCFRKLDLANSF